MVDSLYPDRVTVTFGPLHSHLLGASSSLQPPQLLSLSQQSGEGNRTVLDKEQEVQKL